MIEEMLSSYCKLSLFLCVFASLFDKTDIRERSLPVALHSMVSCAIHWRKSTPSLLILSECWVMKWHSAVADDISSQLSYTGCVN